MYERIGDKHKAFYDKSFVIIKESFTRDLNQYAPKIEIRDYAAFTIFRLSKLGYGSIESLEKMTSKKIIQLSKFEQFSNDYSSIIIQKQKRENGS